MNLPGSPHFHYRDDVLHVEGLALPELAARFGTPLYVYSRTALAAALAEFQSVLQSHPDGSLVCYSVKVNSNLAILDLFARMGAGFDIVSGGELERVLAAGGDPGKVVFSGVGKTEAELAAALQAGILCFNVESAAELERLDRVAGQLGKVAPVSLRVNPDVDPKTHPYIATGLKSSKFGIPLAGAPALYERAARLAHLRVTGVDCHIGSQLLDPRPHHEALERLLPLLETLAERGIPMRHLDLGGGLGIRYRPEETEPTVADYLAPMIASVRGRGLKLLLEPGRRLVGNAGLLLTRVESVKPGCDRNFVIVDAAMNDLIRPALYEAWHEIREVVLRTAMFSGQSADRGAAVRGTAVHKTSETLCDVVGPVCESGDFLGRARTLAVTGGDLLAVLSAGAYGMSMSSNYNSRPRAAEILVDGQTPHLIRRRETTADLYALESRIPA
ncbi:MAG: diaminopimelate decarboxylase [Zoogloeaceae bacterium]|jgi:diaminopimelate decarboxylase|nr:diaminopimelate decarboxylase [Zoogloeaceae bacterium]